MFVDSVRGYKPRYYLVGAVSEEAKASLYRTVTEVVGGVGVSREEPKFPLSWTFEHYRSSTDSYLTKFSQLSEKDRAGLKKLREWVEGFVLGRCVHKVVDEGGNRVTVPLVGVDGKPVFEARLIPTNALLSCTNGAARQVVLENMSKQGGDVLKMLKKKTAVRQG
ncbi:hypothetical protein L195_g022681, partial [Trifolium pratense]